MRMLIAIVSALLLGLLIGSWGPQSEKRQQQEEIDRLRDMLKRREARARPADAVTSMLQIPKAAARERVERKLRKQAQPQVEDARTNTQPQSYGTPAGRTMNATEPDETTDVSENPTVQAFDRVNEAWQMRAEIARANFIADTGLKGEQIEQLDVIVAAMNIRLKDQISKWAQEIGKEDIQSTEGSIRMMNDLSDVLLLTFDEFDRKLPANWREATGDDFDLMTFVDPTVADPLMELELEDQQDGSADN